MPNSEKLKIFVSSSVYGIEELRERIYSLLANFGFEVWCSHMGTAPVTSKMTAFENCIKAVEDCDLFLGIITPSYGSGINGALSITHQEFKKAIELKKPRWLLAHDHVVFTRTLLHDLGYKTPAERAHLNLNKKSKVFNDLRIIDLYEEAVLTNAPLEVRHGNWVQKFTTDEDAMLFATAQFSRYLEVESFLGENFSNPASIVSKIKTAKV